MNQLNGKIVIIYVIASSFTFRYRQNPRSNLIIINVHCDSAMRAPCNI